MARTAGTKLTTPAARLKLKPRAKPYNQTIARRRMLGYVRAAVGAGRWLAIVQTGRSETGSAVRKQGTLGAADDYPNLPGALSYEQAFACAAAWRPDGGTDGALTVREALRRYVAGLRAANGEDAANGAESRLRMNVLREDGKNKPLPGAIGFGERAVASLDKDELRGWRDEMVTRKDAPVRRATANRYLSDFKAALNLAYSNTANGLTSDAAWRGMKKFPKVDNPRKEHFTEAQVLRLIGCARKLDPAFAVLIEAAFLSGARYGELRALDVGHVNAARRQLQIPSGKTGARTCTLTAESTAFFASLAKGREPDEPLLQPDEGGRWLPSMQTGRFKKAAAAARLSPDAVLYSLRHSHVSRAIENGQPLTLIAKNCGTSVGQIEKTYAHMLETKERAMIESTGPRLRLVASKAAA